MKDISYIPTPTLWALFKSLKDQFQNQRPMTNAEENNLWRCKWELRRRGRKFGLTVNVK